MKVFIFLFSILIVVAGGALWRSNPDFLDGVISFLTRVKSPVSKLESGEEKILFAVRKGDVLRKLDIDSGKVVAEKDFQLAFPYGGILERVFVAEGDEVKQGQSLMQLERSSLIFERNRLRSALDEARHNLEKFIAGPTPEDINLAETRVSNADSSIIDAQKNIVDKLSESFTVADDAIRKRVDQFFTDLRSANPGLIFKFGNTGLESAIISQRISIESDMALWKKSFDLLTPDGDLKLSILESLSYLAKISSFLELVAKALSDLMATEKFNQATIDGWRTDVSLARVNVTSAVAGIRSAEEKLTNANSALNLAKSELALKKAGTRPEDIEIARTQISKIEREIQIVDDKINKAVLLSPVSGLLVKKVNFRAGEVFKAGDIAILLDSQSKKVQADISESDIVKVKEGDTMFVVFDALRNMKFSGWIISIEPQPVIKDDETLYRVNIVLEIEDERIRSGMSVDTLNLLLAKDVLIVPADALRREEDGSAFVTIRMKNADTPAKVNLGKEGTEFVEIRKGLREGEKVIVR